MRCNDCNKFVGLELQDEPEAELEVDEGGLVTGSVHLVRECAECGTELKEGNFTVEVLVPAFVEHMQKHVDDRADADKVFADKAKAAKAAGQPEPESDNVDDEEEFEASVEVDSSEATEKGGGRYKKSYFGVLVNFTLTCSCGFESTGTYEDEMAASEMDELT